MNDIVPRSDESAGSVFDVLGRDIRFGITDDNRVYAVASDFAKAIGYRDANKATRLLEDDEAGTQIVGTRSDNGVVQRREMSVIYEDGIWELIFRSSLPGAKLIKKRVKEILRTIRQTGRYESPEYLAGLESRARAWDVLASEGGDFSIRELAFMLNRDDGISTGQNSLFKLLRQLGMIDRRNRPYAKHKDHLTIRMGSEYTDADGRTQTGRVQVRVTPRGAEYIHKRMTA